MKPTANTKYASVIFSGLLLAAVVFPADAAAQNMGASDFASRKMTPCDFLTKEASRFEHGKQPNRTEARYLTDLRRHVADKAYSVQKECAYDSMRLLRKLLQPVGSATADFNHMAAVRRNPSAYVGRPLVLYGRVTGLVRSNRGEVTTDLLAIDSDEVLATIDVATVDRAPRQFPEGGYRVRVIGFFVKTLQ
ncbi:MAG: hypothetical protein AB8G99_20340, partial [Planctomycetaceae bacterium]